MAHSYLQKGPWESLGAFFMYFFILAENGWLAEDLLGVRNRWSSASVNDLQDSYGQEWVIADCFSSDYTVYIFSFVLVFFFSKRHSTTG